MDRDRLIEVARLAMAERKTHPAREKGYVFHHGLRTAELAMHLRGRIDRPLEADPEVVFAAALFHDVGKGIEPHHETGAALTAALLAEACGADQVRAIAAIVRRHNQRGGGEALPVATRLVQDADLLDHFGAQSVWLAFHWSGTHERTCEQTLAFYNGEENRRYLAASRAALNFEATREVYDRRVTFERDFFDRLAAESAGGL
jgi:uncharacterized protein